MKKDASKKGVTVAKNQTYSAADRIRAVACPPADHRTFYRTLTCPAGPGVEALCIHNRISGYMVHFVDGRTRPCIHSQILCQGCRLLQNPRWEGYIGVVLYGSSTPMLAKISAGGFRNSVSLMENDGSLRGMVLQMRRMNKKNNGPLEVSVRPPRKPHNPPDSFSMAEALGRLWGYKNLAEIEGATKDLPAVAELEEGF